MYSAEDIAKAQKNAANRRRLVCKALDFLRDHPALSIPMTTNILSATHWDPVKRLLGRPSSLFDAPFWMIPVCKEGIGEHDGVHVEKSDPRFGEFADLIEDGDDVNEPHFALHVPHERYFGKPWEYDHVAFGISATIYVYMGNDFSSRCDFEYRDWSAYEGFWVTENSFEESVISAARVAARMFGPFNADSFLTDEERHNHETFMPFAIDAAHFLVGNEDYISVSNGVINLRWLWWFLSSGRCDGDYSVFKQVFAQRLEKSKVMPVMPKMVEADFPPIEGLTRTP